MKNKMIIVTTRPPKAPLSGGMAPAMREVAALYDETVWYALSACENRTEGEVRHSVVESINVSEILLSRALAAAHTRNFINQYVWPQKHGLGRLAKAFDAADLRGYVAVNALMADLIARDLGDDHETPVFIQDNHHYQLALELRQRGRKNPIGFFDHTPVPDPAGMSASVRARFTDKLFRPVMHADFANFQTADNARNFMKFLGIENPPMLGAYETRTLNLSNGHKLRVGHFPISINTAKVMEMAGRSDLTEKGRALVDRLEAPNIFINFERADYTKDLSSRLKAFQLLLDRHPDMRGKVQMTACAEPSRTDIGTYVDVAREAQKMAEAINATYSDAWVGGQPPVVFLNENIPHSDIPPIMRGDESRRMIGCITAWADGMNLVAKEFVAAQDPACAGPLILSSGAGASHELAHGALLFEPGDVEHLYRQMLEAVNMPQDRANRRCARMQAHLRSFDIARWGREHDRLFDKIADERDSDLTVPATARFSPRPHLKLVR